MCKALPGHPLGYSLFARCAMNGQQMKVAQMFLDKGLQVSEIQALLVCETLGIALSYMVVGSTCSSACPGTVRPSLTNETQHMYLTHNCTTTLRRKSAAERLCQCHWTW
jgi:hypothetical protein